MTPIQAFRHVNLPQMLRMSFLPMTKQLAWAILMSSLGAVVAINTDLHGVTGDLNARTFRTFGLFGIAAVIFSLIAKAIPLSARLLAARLFRYWGDGHVRHRADRERPGAAGRGAGMRLVVPAISVFSGTIPGIVFGVIRYRGGPGGRRR